MLLTAILLSTLIGVSLALLGGGGSILTVPILVYALGVEEKSAIGSSLLIVAVTSAAAAVHHWRAGNVRWSIAFVFSAASMAGAFAGGRLAAFIPGGLLIALFAVVMLATGAAMWRKGRKPIKPDAHEHAPRQGKLPIAKIAIQGVAVGAVTGLVGAGGGFLVVPALALLGGLPMRQAVGTSLVVIALNSVAGFGGYVSHVEIDYALIGYMSLAAVAGSFAGAAFSRRVSQEKLRQAFAAFVLVMAMVLLFKQLRTADLSALTPILHAPWPAWVGGAAAVLFLLAILVGGGRLLGGPRPVREKKLRP